MVVAPISRISVREIYCDFAEIPFYSEFTTAMMQEPDPDANTVGLFFRPFKREVWISILAAIPLAGVVLLFYVRAYRIVLPRRQNHTPLHHIVDSLWFSGGALLQQGKKSCHVRHICLECICIDCNTVDIKLSNGISDRQCHSSITLVSHYPRKCAATVYFNTHSQASQLY